METSCSCLLHTAVNGCVLQKYVGRSASSILHEARTAEYIDNCSSLVGILRKIIIKCKKNHSKHKLLCSDCTNELLAIVFLVPNPFINELIFYCYILYFLCNILDTLDKCVCTVIAKNG